MRDRSQREQAGLSLIELMVSISLGLLVLVGVLLVFTSSNNSRNEMEKSSRQIGNGSYAMHLLSQDLQLAGYFGELPAPPTPTLALAPDPCEAADLSKLAGAMQLHVQGYDNSSGNLSCLRDVKPATDVLVVRRSSTCSSANPRDTDANNNFACDDITTGYTYLQVSGCNSDPAPSGQLSQPYFLLDSNRANLILNKIGCTNQARILRYRTHIYFIASNNNPGDGIPTLKRWELGQTGTGIVPLVEGIDNLQLEYGIDANADGIADSYSADPTGGNPANFMNWANVMAVKVHLLARNTELTADYSDNKTYELGLSADGSANSVGPFHDAFKRHAYAATVRLASPAGRRE